MTENPDEAVLRAVLGADPDEYLRGQVRAGASPETIIEDVATRSRGLLRLSRTSLDGLTQDAVAAVSPSQSVIDAATIEAAVGMPVGPYLRQKIAEGKSRMCAHR